MSKETFDSLLHKVGMSLKGVHCLSAMCHQYCSLELYKWHAMLVSPILCLWEYINSTKSEIIPPEWLALILQYLATGNSQVSKYACNTGSNDQLACITSIIKAHFQLLTVSAHAREGYCSHFLCQSVCHFLILEKAIFSVLKLISVHSRWRFKSFKCNISYFGVKVSGTSAFTAVTYAATAQSLNGLARDLLASGVLYQSCHLHCSCVGFFP